MPQVFAMPIIDLAWIVAGMAFGLGLLVSLGLGA